MKIKLSPLWDSRNEEDIATCVMLLNISKRIFNKLVERREDES